MFLLEASRGPILLYAKKMNDPKRAYQASLNSEFPIDHEHRDVVREVFRAVEVEELLNLSAFRERQKVEAKPCLDRASKALSTPRQPRSRATR
jgi:hypothetical protein